MAFKEGDAVLTLKTPKEDTSRAHSLSNEDVRVKIKEGIKFEANDPFSWRQATNAGGGCPSSRGGEVAGHNSGKYASLPEFKFFLHFENV
jgi:hypothetical protein